MERKVSEYRVYFKLGLVALLLIAALVLFVALWFPKPANIDFWPFAGWSWGGVPQRGNPSDMEYGAIMIIFAFAVVIMSRLGNAIKKRLT